MSATRIKELGSEAATAIEAGEYNTALTKIRALWVLVETTPGMSRESLSVDFRSNIESLEARAKHWLAESNAGGMSATNKIRRTRISRRPVGYFDNREVG